MTIEHTTSSTDLIAGIKEIAGAVPSDLGRPKVRVYAKTSASPARVRVTHFHAPIVTAVRAALDAAGIRSSWCTQVHGFGIQISADERIASTAPR
tara:strand:- start:316 stop:600 length:285 start_codon:yes stop_codon:yes gene_type:complete